VYTRCPGCHTVHPINAAVLAQAGGVARCGKCNKSVDLLESLFDSWPDPGSKPAPSRSGSARPPELGAIPVQASDPEPADDPPPPEPGKDDSGRILWAGACALLAALAVLNIATMPGLSDWPPIRNALVAAGLSEAPPAPRFSDMASIHLAARDMQVHPTRPEALVLSLTMVNRAAQRQDYPVLELTLTDNRSNAIARRYFDPVEYLPRTADGDRGMTPDALVALSLEFADPGDQAVGFELRFHPASG
jgi:predicted Zn finger-like uncharacterized protein